MEDTIEKRFLNSKELAHYLGLKEPTIRDWIRQKRIPFHKLGKSIRFDRLQIESWLATKQN